MRSHSQDPHPRPQPFPPVFFFSSFSRLIRRNEESAQLVIFSKYSGTLKLATHKPTSSRRHSFFMDRSNLSSVVSPPFRDRVFLLNESPKIPLIYSNFAWNVRARFVYTLPLQEKSLRSLYNGGTPVRVIVTHLSSLVPSPSCPELS